MDQFKLGKRELIALFILSVGIKLTDYTPDLFFPHSLMSAWMNPIVCGLYVTIPLMIVTHLITKYEVGIVEVSKLLLGKFFGSITSLFIFVFMLLSTAFLVHNYANILNILYYPQDSIEFFVLILVIVCFLLAYGGPYVIGRTGWVLLPSVQIAVVLLLILSFITNHLNFTNIFPLFGNGIDIVLKESLFKNAIFCEFIVFACLIPFVKQAKEYKTAALVSLLFVVVQMTLVFMMYIFVFDAYSVVNMTLPFQHLTRTIQLGRFITNFEVFFLIFWLIASLIKFAIYFYVTTIYFTQTFNIKTTKDHLLPITMLILLVAIIPENIIETFIYSRSTSLTAGSIFFLVFPFVLLMFSFRKKGASKQQ